MLYCVSTASGNSNQCHGFQEVERRNTWADSLAKTSRCNGMDNLKNYPSQRIDRGLKNEQNARNAPFQKKVNEHVATRNWLKLTEDPKYHSPAAIFYGKITNYCVEF